MTVYLASGLTTGAAHRMSPVDDRSTGAVDPVQNRVGVSAIADQRGCENRGQEIEFRQTGKHASHSGFDGKGKPLTHGPSVGQHLSQNPFPIRVYRRCRILTIISEITAAADYRAHAHV